MLKHIFEQEMQYNKHVIFKMEKFWIWSKGQKGDLWSTGVKDFCNLNICWSFLFVKRGKLKPHVIQWALQYPIFYFLEPSRTVIIFYIGSKGPYSHSTPYSMCTQLLAHCWGNLIRLLSFNLLLTCLAFQIWVVQVTSCYRNCNKLWLYPLGPWVIF